MFQHVFRSPRFLLVTVLLILSQTVVAQDKPVAKTAEKLSQQPASKAVIFTTEQDHADMLKRLGITKLRPGATPTRTNRTPPIMTKQAQTRIPTCRTS